MRRVHAAVVVAISVALLATVDRAAAQVPQRGARIGYVYPAGGQQGTTVRLTLGGQFLNDIGRVTFSGAISMDIER